MKKEKFPDQETIRKWLGHTSNKEQWIKDKEREKEEREDEAEEDARKAEKAKLQSFEDSWGCSK